ncbi:MAG: Uma2 family endonuclease [Planctomycetota bacterium]|nr:Uma2 family endonuclease [Planctomycetota bacterium]
MPTTSSPARKQTDQRFVLHGVDWRFYDTVLKALGDRHIFVTYDRGSLELMSPSSEHECYKIALRRIIETVAFELAVEIRSCGSTTFRREDLERGLEPDECYYIKNAALLNGVMKIDLERHPPPDLAVEIDVTSSSLDRQAVYAALGVAELWRYDGRRLRVYHLRRGQYKLSGKSLNLPFLPLREVERFLEAAPGSQEMAWLRSLQQWVRAHLKRP